MKKEVKILNGGIFPPDAAKLTTLHKYEVVLSNKDLEKFIIGVDMAKDVDLSAINIKQDDMEALLKEINNCSDHLHC